MDKLGSPLHMFYEFEIQTKYFWTISWDLLKTLLTLARPSARLEPARPFHYGIHCPRDLLILKLALYHFHRRFPTGRRKRSWNSICWWLELKSIAFTAIYIFWGSSQNWTIARNHFYAFWGLLKISSIFFFGGELEIPDIFGGWRVDAGPEPTYEELEDLTVLKRSPYLLNNVKIGQYQLRLIMKHILFCGGSSDLKQSKEKMFR